MYFRPKRRFSRVCEFFTIFHFFHLSANTWYSFIFDFYPVSPLPQPPFTGAVPRRIQYNTLMFHPSVVRRTFSLDFFFTFLNANCSLALFHVPPRLHSVTFPGELLFFIFLYLYIVYYCIFKDIISNVLVCLVKFINNKFVPEKKLYLTKTLLQKEKKND